MDRHAIKNQPCTPTIDFLCTPLVTLFLGNFFSQENMGKHDMKLFKIIISMAFITTQSAVGMQTLTGKVKKMDNTHALYERYKKPCCDPEVALNEIRDEYRAISSLNTSEYKEQLLVFPYTCMSICCQSLCGLALPKSHERITSSVARHRSGSAILQGVFTPTPPAPQAQKMDHLDKGE